VSFKYFENSLTTVKVKVAPFYLGHSVVTIYYFCGS